jgi:signal transduction histidine kinase/HAMP domain-containing protein
MTKTTKRQEHKAVKIKLDPRKLKLAKPLDKVRPKARFGIRGKIMISFLALVFISLGIISALAVRSIYEVGHRARVNSFSMGEEVVRTSIAALEDLGRVFIQRRAVYVANEMKLFMELQPSLDVSTLKDNKDLRDIAVQLVGQTGYTMVYDKSYVVIFHVEPKMVGVNLHSQVGEPSKYLSIVERSLFGESSGYYDWTDENNQTRSKFMSCVPVEGTDLIVAASTYIDEFSAPAEAAQRNIASAVAATSKYIDDQMQQAQLTFMVVIFCVLVVAGVVIFLLSRAITGPIQALAKGAEVIGSGELDYSIEAKTGDEIEDLAERFNIMAAALKESYTNLEKKVEDRTKKERERVEQLRTINEVSRKISSIVDLDELISNVSDTLRQTFHYYNVNIFLMDPESNRLTLKSLYLGGQKGVIPVTVPLEVDQESIVGWVARIGEPLCVNDVSKEPRYRAIEALGDTKSELAVAIKLGDKVFGVLDIESAKHHAFGEADIFTAQTLADQLAVAIENARLYGETREMAVMEERNRMAREIHDTLAQGFTGIILQLEAAEQAFSDSPPEAERHLNQASNLARKSLAEARRSVWNLRPKALEQANLADALKQEVSKFSEQNDVNATCVLNGDRQDLSPDVETGLLRICQESLNNVRKYAKATNVEVSLAFDTSTVTLTISDDGAGFEQETRGKGGKKRRGFGLISMQERARGLGGTFEVQSEKGAGTVVRVTVPIS